MIFNAIRENKILSKISGFTVLHVFLFSEVEEGRRPLLSERPNTLNEMK